MDAHRGRVESDGGFDGLRAENGRAHQGPPYAGVSRTGSIGRRLPAALSARRPPLRIPDSRWTRTLGAQAHPTRLGWSAARGAGTLPEGPAEMHPWNLL
ncbi:hypothetical protein GCM10007967_12720 [Xylanimonas ulmi]